MLAMHCGEEPCDRKRLPVVTPSVPGGRTRKSKQPREAVPKDDKIGNHWVIFNPSGFQLSGCKSSTMAEVSLAQTRMQMLSTHSQWANTNRKAVVQ